MRNLVLLLCLAMAGAAFAQPPDQPIHPARRYVIRGELKAVSASQLTVEGRDRHGGPQTTLTLKVTDKSSVAEGLKVGDRVVVDYNHTLENDVYEVLSARKARAR